VFALHRPNVSRETIVGALFHGEKLKQAINRREQEFSACSGRKIEFAQVAEIARE
jgi:hypothetical protein